MPIESVAGTFPFAAGKIPLCRTEITPEAQHAAVRVLASGWVTTGSESAEFEREFAAWVGAPYAVAISSCTAAIQLALLGLDLPHGAPVHLTLGEVLETLIVMPGHMTKTLLMVAAVAAVSLATKNAGA